MKNETYETYKKCTAKPYLILFLRQINLHV